MEQAAARDHAARGDDARPPRLAAAEQRHELQRGHDEQHPDGRLAQRLREVGAMPGEHEGQHDRDRQRSRGGRRGAAAQPLGHPRAPRLGRVEAVGFAKPNLGPHRGYPFFDETGPRSTIEESDPSQNASPTGVDAPASAVGARSRGQGQEPHEPADQRAASGEAAYRAEKQRIEKANEAAYARGREERAADAAEAAARRRQTSAKGRRTCPPSRTATDDRSRPERAGAPRGGGQAQPRAAGPLPPAQLQRQGRQLPDARAAAGVDAADARLSQAGRARTRRIVYVGR